VTAAAAHAKTLKVNLIMDGGTIMIYAGANDAVKVGDVYSVMRADREIGKIEITRVEATYAVAKVVSQNEEIREMDLLVMPVSVSDTKADAKKSDPKADAKKDDKKSDDKKASDKKSDDKKKDDDKKEETKTSAKKKASKDDAKSGDEEKKDEKADKKKDEKKEDKDSGKDEKKEDKKEAAAAKAAPVEKAGANLFPCISGPSGLFQMPTAFVASAGGGGVSLFMYKESRNASGLKVGGLAGEQFIYSESLSMDRKSLGFAYAFNENVEISGAQIQTDMSLSLDALTYFELVTGSGEADYKTTVLGVKFNPRKKYLLQPGTHKAFEYAFGVQNYSSSGDGEDLTQYYAAIAMPGSKLTFHGVVYRVDADGIGSKKWGSMAGIESPLTDSALFIADMDQFRGEETYTLGLRYLLGDNAALSVAVYDITDSHNTMFSGSFKF
jgi:hypothetical protein